ncbi:MAG TPA: PH domain-containing protein [Thiotrichales bacterium]|nr:PH domain-containing protein [Thiotrichales bacterium]
MSIRNDHIPLEKHPLPHEAAATPAGPETPVWRGRRGQLSRLGTYVFCGLTFWLFIPLLWALWTWLATRCNTYELTSQRLRVRHGVFNRDTEEVELYRVKDISVREPLVYRLAGRGTIVLDTSDRTTPVVALQAIPDPAALHDILRETVEQCRLAKGVREID